MFNLAQLVIAVDGSVKSVRVDEDRSTTRRRVLVNKAVELFKRWTFDPATRDGVPFECTYPNGSIRFEIDDS